MNISLKNRKDLSNKLTDFIDCAILESDLIKEICENKIDETYIECINKLR
jgi:hypothetical protein